MQVGLRYSTLELLDLQPLLVDDLIVKTGTFNERLDIVDGASKDNGVRLLHAVR